MSTSLPPPLPPQPPPLRTTPVNVAGVNTAGLTATEISQAIQRGGRFVVFPFCVSVIILSFKRSSPVIFMKPGESALGRGAPYCLISLLAGWWGIPWGPIWTIATLVTNLGGGKDVTQEVLNALGLPLPNPTAQGDAPPLLAPEVHAARETHKTRLLRLAWTIVVLVFLGFAGLTLYVVRTGNENTSDPGRAQFRLASNTIRSGGAMANGDTSEAINLAQQMSLAMRQFRESNFQKSKETSSFDFGDSFKSYCKLSGTRCVFLVHIPELRRFDAAGKASFGLAAWNMAQDLLRRIPLGQSEIKLAVALQGLTTYDRVLTGVVMGANGTNSVSPLVYTRIGCEKELLPWFNPTADTPFTFLSTNRVERGN